MSTEPRPLVLPRPPAASEVQTSPAVRFAILPVLERQPWDALTPALLRTGGDVDQALTRLKQYAQLLLEWNRGVSNIMSRNDEDRIVDRHLLESIEPASWLRESGSQRWIDFGSGAGFPAVPLVIAGAGGKWTLVESRRMKTLFVRKALQELVLQDITVVNDRLENVVLAPEMGGAFDGFTSRATMRIGPTLAMASSLVAVGGHAFLWKGSGYEAEMTQDPAWRSDWGPPEILKVGSGSNVVVRFIRKQAD